MSALSFLLLSVFCGGLSLTVVAIANKKKRKQRFLKRKLQQLKHYVEELEERVLILDTLCETRSIPRLLNEDVIERYEAILKLEPDSTHTNVCLSNAKLRQEQLLNQDAPRNLSYICNSDAHIARQQTCLNIAATALRNQRDRGKLSESELKEYLTELTWFHLQVEVITFIAKGHKAYNEKDSISANGYYKKAQSLLIASLQQDPRKERMVKEISDILLNKRRFLSQDLMPETQFNPTKSFTPEPLESAEDTDKTDDISLETETETETETEVKQSTA